MRDEDVARRLRVRVLMDRQGKRFFCFHTWLACLTFSVIIDLAVIINKNTWGDAVHCSADGTHWFFKSCTARFVVNFSHVFTAMQCGAMARVVFVKTVKKVELEESYSRITTRFIRGDGEVDQD